MGVATILVMWPKNVFAYILAILSLGVFTWNLSSMGQWFVRKQYFDIFMGLQYERPKLKDQRSTLTSGTYL